MPEHAAAQRLLEGFLQQYRRDDETLSETVARFATEIADRSPRTVWRWLSGDTEIPLETVRRIRETLRTRE